MVWFPKLKHKDVLTNVFEALSGDWRSKDDIFSILEQRRVKTSSGRVGFALRRLAGEKVVEKKFVFYRVRPGYGEDVKEVDDALTAKNEKT